MRILMISDVYFPRINGVSTSIRTFRRTLAARGVEVSLIAPDYGFGQGDDEDVVRIPARKVLLDPEDRMMKMNRLMWQAGELRRRNYDLVHIQTPFVAHYAGVALARRLGIPRVETYHTFFEEYLYNYVPFLPRAGLKFLARRFSCAQCNNVDAVVVPSLAMLEVLRGYGVTTPTEIIPTGIEPVEFSHGDGAGFRRRHGIGPARPVLVHVGRIAHEKNIDFLLLALQRVRATIPDVLLVIAGEGPAVAHLRRLTDTLGLRESVHFVGYLSRDAGLQDCYCAGDAFVFASRTETQGLVLLEAMSLGVPVVSTAVMGTRDILRDGRGALVAREDTGDFAEKVVTVLSDAALRARLAAEAREYAATWTAGAIAGRMLDLYQARLAQFRGGESGPLRQPA